MSASEISWPLSFKPDHKSKVVLASQGIRLWTAECELESFGTSLKLHCSDRPTLENLRKQKRVAFIISGEGGTAQGNGMAVVSGDFEPDGVIELEPYRLSSGDETWELRLKGWIKVEDAALPDISKYAFWYQAFRLVTLPLSGLSVLAGGAVALAQGRLDPWLLLLSLIGAVCAHAGANAAADYFDFKSGVDSSKALSSHLGALAREKVEPEMILLAAFACFLVTAIAGIILLLAVGWQLLIFGAIGLLGAFFYTGRPISYKYRALGELMLGVLVGSLIVMGSYFVQTKGWDWAAFLVSAALGMLISSISLVNNLRDMPDDRAAGIRTLPMSLGINRTKTLYYGLTLCPYLAAAAAILVQIYLWPLAIILVSLPQAFKTIKDLRSTRNDIEEIRAKALACPYPLNSIRLHTQFGALAVAGLAIAGIIRLVTG